MGLDEGGRHKFQEYYIHTDDFMVDEDEVKNPRGVRGFALNKGNFSEWKVQGKIGGYNKYVSYLSCPVDRVI